MTRSRETPSTPQKPTLDVPREKLEASLSDQIKEGDQFFSRKTTVRKDIKELCDDSETWDEFNTTLLRKSFTTSDLVEEYASLVGNVLEHADIKNRRLRSRLNPGQLHEVLDILGDIDARNRWLRSLLTRLPLYEEKGNTEVRAGTLDPAVTGNRVFIVHGHDEATRQSVARFVRQATGSEPIILHEQPSSGRTIIEKFEDHADEITFAIVLLTGDDEGSERGSGKCRLRARQNVILELGFFIATLGRQRVAALHQNGVELPSDLRGVLYTPLDSDWRLKLGREMRAAGLTVDINRVH